MKSVYDPAVIVGEEVVDEHGDRWRCVLVGANGTIEFEKIDPPRGIFGKRMIVRRMMPYPDLTKAMPNLHPVMK